MKNPEKFYFSGFTIILSHGSATLTMKNGYLDVDVFFA